MSGFARSAPHRVIAHTSGCSSYWRRLGVHDTELLQPAEKSGELRYRTVTMRSSAQSREIPQPGATRARSSSTVVGWSRHADTNPRSFLKTHSAHGRKQQPPLCQNLNGGVRICTGIDRHTESARTLGRSIPSIRSALISANGAPHLLASLYHGASTASTQVSQHAVASSFWW